MTEAVIVSTARTPIGKAFRGAFNNTHGAVLGGHVIKHAVERAAIFSDGPSLTIEGFGNLESVENLDERAKGAQAMVRSVFATDVRDAKDRVEANLILEAMERNGGNKKRVAEELGISRSYLYKRLREIVANRDDTVESL